MKDTRFAEIAWLLVIALLIALGGNVLLALLAAHRTFAALLLAALVVAASFGVRRAFAGNGATVRSDVTKAAAYLIAAILAFVAIGLHVHWAIGACIAAAEVAIVFDIMTIASRQRDGTMTKRT